MRPIYLILFFLFSCSSAGAVTAGFTVDYSGGCSPLVVHFTNTSTGATSYSWNLGNGTTTPSTNPSTSYIAVGTYTVTLTAYSGSTTSVHTMVITVYPLPTVSFTASDTTVCPGEPVSFVSSSVGGVPGPMTYIWNFGDGVTSTAAAPTHIYNTPGSYNVTLSVTNSQGCVKLLTRVGYIFVYTRPAASFTGSPTSICSPPGTVSFFNFSTGALPLSYNWTFGSGAPSTLATPSNVYTTPGTYTVKLVVTDAHGCKDSSTRPAYIYVADLHAAFTCPPSACKGVPVSFPNTSSPHTSRFWTYGDGSASDTAYNGSHVFIAPGTYTVTLTINSGPCTAVESHVIVISPPPPATFSIAPSDPCPAPVTLTYTSTTPAGYSVSWLYPDGSTGAGPVGTKTYTTNGVKLAKMILTGPGGCIDTVAKLDTLYDLTFIGLVGPREGCAPLLVNFSASAYTRYPDTLAPFTAYPYPLTSYSWSFGDGSAPGSGATPTHTYTAPGIYTATVTATTSNGCVVADTMLINVGAPPVVTFSVTPSHVCYGDLVTFTVTIISGPVSYYEWAFGDELLTSSGGTFIRSYTLPGVFTVTLTPFYNGCPGPAFVSTTVVTVDSPKAIIRHTHACTPHIRVNFADSSMGDDTHLWMFGDGTTSTLDHPVHDYPSLGTYTVTLATYNASSGCRDTAIDIISLTVPPLDFVAHDTAVCTADTVHFAALCPGGAAHTYRWYVNGLTNPWWIDSVMTDTFTVAGLYSVMLVVENAFHCPDTVTKLNYIIVGDPTVHFSTVPPTGCWPLSVTFTDASTDVPGVTIATYIWDYGDGGAATVGSPVTTHTYTAAGTYTVKETVIDIIGCKDSLTGPTPITVYRPHASFTATNVRPCIGVPTTFSNSSTGAVSSFWTFGDGGTSTSTSPSHAYAGVGVYTVRLVVTDIHGCTDTMTRPAYITVSQPTAGFNMSDTFSICPPLLVTFLNTSVGASLYSWTFGDGNISALLSPTNMYTTAGLYDIRLIASDLWGCTDTAYNRLNLFGYAGSFTYTPLTGCAPHLVHFTAAISNVPTIIWDFGDGSTSVASLTDTASHLYTLPGAYTPKLILSDFTGCQNSSIGPFLIKVEQITAKFDVAPSACIGLPFNLVDSSTWYWSPVNSWFWTYGTDTSSLPSPVHMETVPGKYPVTLTVKNSWGCTATLSDSITVYPPPIVTTSPDTVVCVGDPATLYGYGALTYEWSPAATLSCINCNPTAATPPVVSQYTVIGTDVHGCRDTASVIVGLRTNTISNAWGDTAVCNGTGVQLFDTGGTRYKWIPAGGLSNDTIYNPIASPGSTTTYTVIAQLASCIPDTDYVKVEVFPSPTVNAGIDQEVLAGTLVQLAATGQNIATFEWWPSTGLSCYNCRNPDAIVLYTTTYVVNVTSIHGCKNSDSVTIYLYCGSKQVFVPNVFTPNGDGENDVFYPRGAGITIIKSFRIYNRWGQLLFERSNINVNDASNAWDGSYMGDIPKPDVYVYVIDAVCSTGKPVMIKGDVTIVR